MALLSCFSTRTCYPYPFTRHGKQGTVPGGQAEVPPDLRYGVSAHGEALCLTRGFTQPGMIPPVQSPGTTPRGSPLSWEHGSGSKYLQGFCTSAAGILLRLPKAAKNCNGCLGGSGTSCTELTDDFFSFISVPLCSPKGIIAVASLACCLSSSSSCILQKQGDERKEHLCASL